MKKSHIILTIIAVLVFPITCAVYHTACNVATAPLRVVNKTMETDNIIENYEWFYDTHHQIKARVNQIKQHKDFLSSETDRDEIRKLRIEMAGMQQSCRDMVEKYNSHSKKMNREIFKAKNLPHQLDINVCE